MKTAFIWLPKMRWIPLQGYPFHQRPHGSAWLCGYPADEQADTFRLYEEYASWVWDNWNWGKTWGWDYPMTAMNATRWASRKGCRRLCWWISAPILLLNGHNYQDGRLRCYLPGNGGLLTAVALMCAGWDGCEVKNPGFPQDGTWDVRWEGLKPMP